MTKTDRDGLEALPLTVFLRLEEMCGRYEAAWQTAHQGRSGPRIEDYLRNLDREGEATAEPGSPEVMGTLRRALERELVRIDIAYRHRAGEAPRSWEYLSRFPGLDRDWLASALAEAGRQRPPGTPNPRTHDTPGEDALSPPAVAAPPLSLPTRFGDYELLQEIARGGMGVVYKARQPSLDRIVALKMILPGQPLVAEAVARFLREARAAAALDHPNIVAIHASGEHNGRPFFTMAYVEGDNLRVVVGRQGLPAPPQAADLLRAVAEAVGCAHLQGIIHRDLKPENVLIDRQGRARVTDFGLAYRPEAETTAERLTRLGEVLGTPAYMSPEQATGTQELGPATDIYSLGGILYFLLTGQPPFQGRSLSEVLLQVMTGTPRPPREVNAQASPALEAICLRCLEKDPARRYPSAAALAAALRAVGRPETSVEPKGPVTVTVRRSGPPAAPPAPTAHPSGRFWIPGARAARWTRLGLAVAVVVALAVGVWLVTSNTPLDDAKPQDQPPLPATQLAPPVKLRTDFPLTVAMLDDKSNVLKPGADGLLPLRAGEAVKFRIKLAQAAYVGVWSVNGDGTVCQLFPNDEEKDHYFKQDEVRDVPQTRAEAYECKEQGKFDWVWVQVSTRPWDSDHSRRVGPFLIFQDDRERARWRDQRGGIRLRAGVGLTEAVLKYRVVAR